MPEYYYNYNDYYEGLATYTALLMIKYINPLKAYIECFPTEEVKQKEKEGWVLCNDQTLLEEYLKSISEYE